MIKWSHDSILVFNSLSWARSGWVEQICRMGEMIVGYRDQTTSAGRRYCARGWYTTAGLWRPDEPRAIPGRESAGARRYSTFDDRSGNYFERFGACAIRLPVSTGNVLENAYYRSHWTLNTGPLSSIFDKQLQRELVDATARLLWFLYLRSRR